MKHKSRTVTRKGFYFNYYGKNNRVSEIEIEPFNIGLFLNFHENYACPYYTDRADIICPEINRLAQVLRAFGSKIIFYTQEEMPFKTDSTNDNQYFDEQFLNETSPDLKDICLYSDYNEEPSIINTSIHHSILYSKESDIFVENYPSLIAVSKQFNITHLIVSGMHCNQWVPGLFQSLITAGVTPLYLYDLSDVTYSREAQIAHFTTHTEALKHFWVWIRDKYGYMINHFSLLDRDPPPSNKRKVVNFDGNQNAFFFYELYANFSGI